MPPYPVLLWATVALWAGSEIALAVARRAPAGASRDRGSFGRIWATIAASVALAVWAGTAGALPMPAWRWLGWAGLGVMLAGMTLRAAAILTLRRLFTVNVAIQDGHRLVEHGVYRRVRHPSYAGALVSFVGFGLTTRSWLALAAIALPMLAVFAHRMRIEETALEAALGEPYRAYRSRTARLVPWLY